MKRVMRLVMIMTLAAGLNSRGLAQGKIDEQRMERDIEVAENILSTLMRQHLSKRNFFPLEVHGNYLPGYGVTFRLPQGGPFNMFMIEMDAPDVMVNPGATRTYSYESKTYKDDDDCEDCEKIKGKRGRSATAVRINKDSLSASADKRFIEVAKNFLADYGDVLSQLRPDEKIVITNREEDSNGDFNLRWPGGGESRRNLITLETKREEITQFKQNKVTREQFITRLKIITSEPSESLDPDLEVLASMFSRLYREDLSKTYYSQGHVTYERLKDYGVIYYMKVYSSLEEDNERFYMPTIAMKNISRSDRDKKVKELYPKFESELKDYLVEYGRTLRSLKDNEQLMFNAKLTRCEECGIPSSIELSVPYSVLKEFNAGKIGKDAALGKVVVKKTGTQ